MKILLIKLSSIGDLVHSIPAYQALSKSLKNDYPELQVDWLVYKNLAPTLHKSINRERLIYLEDKKFTSLISKATELKNQYDHVIDLQGLFKTALISKIIAPNSNYGFKMPRETWARYFYTKGFCDYKSIESKKHVIEQNLELVSRVIKEITGKETNTEIDFALKLENNESKTKKQFCIIPATTWESKHWQIENWAELLKDINEDEYDLFVTGTPANLPYLKQIQIASRKDMTFIVDKKLEELYEFYQTMDIIVGVDTGPLHIAAAALYKQKEKKKIIGIYGPSSGARSGPYGFTAISADELFSLKASNKKTYLQDRNSINRIHPELVLKALS